MAGTVAGGKHAAETNKRLYGDGFYARIGEMGGTKSRLGGFAYSKLHGLDTHIKAGQKGGKISSRLGIPNGGKRDLK